MNEAEGGGQNSSQGREPEDRTRGDKQPYWEMDRAEATVSHSWIRLKAIEYERNKRRRQFSSSPFSFFLYTWRIF